MQTKNMCKIIQSIVENYFKRRTRLFLMLTFILGLFVFGLGLDVAEI